MDFVNYIKRTNFKVLGKVLFSREEVYNENSGDMQAIQVMVKPDYYNAEFELNGKNKDDNKEP